MSNVTNFNAVLTNQMGTVVLDGTNPTSVEIADVDTLQGAVVSLEGTAAPGVGTSVLTYQVDSGTLNIYAWKVTSDSDPTLVASDGTETVSYFAWGV